MREMNDYNFNPAPRMPGGLLSPTWLAPYSAMEDELVMNKTSSGARTNCRTCKYPWPKK